MEISGAHFERGELPKALTNIHATRISPQSWDAFVGEPPPMKGAIVGTWTQTPSDALAEVLVVRDEDFSDTLAWLNSYFAGLAPITQWCRILSYSSARHLFTSRTPYLGSHLTMWVGAVLAECSVQAGGLQNLKEIPTSAALSTATYAAGRSTAIFGDESDLVDLASRHDFLSSALSSRPLVASRLVPLWATLSGNFSEIHQNRDDLAAINNLLVHIGGVSGDFELADLVKQLAMQAVEYFGIPELGECAFGPQVNRVKALDRLVGVLSARDGEAVVDALLGMAASFVDPGSAVSPELLRRHGRRFGVAPIWQGVFAGAMVPLRVMTDQGGLGRSIGKSLVSQSDLQSRPTCDIAFEELMRWITPGRPLRLDVRGYSATAINVEITPGVTCAYSIGRPSNASTQSVSSASSSSHSRSDIKTDIDRSRPTAAVVSELEASLKALYQRVVRLENAGQQTFDLGDSNTTRARKSSRNQGQKK